MIRFGTLLPVGSLQRESLALAALILVNLVVACISLVCVLEFYKHLGYDPGQLSRAVVVVILVLPLVLLFAFVKFSFGYFVGFYFSSMIVGYLWLSFFSSLQYDRVLAGFSAAASLVAFLLPALFVSSPVERIRTISPRAFDNLLIAILLLCAATAVVGATHNFKLVNPDYASDLRSDSFPTALRYLMPMSTSSLLPFLFASFLVRKARWLAGATLALLLFYYPIIVSKVAFFAPAWLVLMVLFSRMFGARISVVLSLLLPVFVGVVLYFLSKDGVAPLFATRYFVNVNIRIAAIPSIALDVYNEFFSSHPLTYFCQIQIVKSVVGCPYQDQLSLVMLKHYPFGGNFNASLFATEGIASLGAAFAPVSAFAAGLVIALANRLSAGLPPWFVLVSGAILVQILVNVPLSTVLLTHGAGLLFLLWGLTPRSIFERSSI